MTRIKFGILGCGSIAARFAKALALSEDAELTACAARDEARAQAFAAEHGGKAYGSYEALLADPEVQAVYIATVHTTHAALAQMAIRAGKAVISEKPFFVNGREAEETIAMAREKGVLVMEGFWTRTMPAYLKAKEWIQEGKIGEIKLIRAAFCFNMPYDEQWKNHRLWNPEVGGGALLDAGVYPYEYVTGIMDGPPISVKATVSRAPTGVDGAVAMTLEYPGVIANCLTAINGYMDDVAVLSGSKGYIKQYYFLGCRRTELYQGRGELVEVFEDPQEEGFVHEITHFCGLLRDGKTESELIPLGDNLDFAKRAEAILQDSRRPSKFSLEELAQQEQELRFASFGPNDAQRLGKILCLLAESDRKAAAVQIELNGLEVFRVMPEGTGAYQELWMKKKKSTVKQLGKSTLRLWTEMAARGMARKIEMEPAGSIVFCGGGFPILLEDGTVLGVIVVSGPGDEYEHELIVRGLREFQQSAR